MFAYSKLSEPTSALTDAEMAIMRRAKRWVIFLAFFQLAMAIFSANILQWLLAAIFVPLGIVGVTRQQPRFLVAHFVYSVFQYVGALIGIVWLILYCDECRWPIYVFAFLIVLIQALGMRHSRILIALIKIQQAASLPVVNNTIVEQQQSSIEMQQQPQQQQQQIVVPQEHKEVEQQQQQFPAFPQPVYYAIPMPYGQQPQQGMAPQYYPMAYPFLHPQQQQHMMEAPTVYKQ